MDEPEECVSTKDTTKTRLDLVKKCYFFYSSLIPYMENSIGSSIMVWVCLDSSGFGWFTINGGNRSIWLQNKSDNSR